MGMIPGSFIVVEDQPVTEAGPSATSPAPPENEPEHERLLREFKQLWQKLLQRTGLV